MLYTVAQYGGREGRYWAPKSKLPYSEIALSPKPLGIEHMYIYTFYLRITYIMTSQNIYLSSWDTMFHTFEGKSHSGFSLFLPSKMHVI